MVQRKPLRAYFIPFYEALRTRSSSFEVVQAVADRAEAGLL
jgi:hypothetical protein